MTPSRLIVAITGASGAVYGERAHDSEPDSLVNQPIALQGIGGL